MAYNEKYFLSFCNPLGQSCRVSILQDDFVGVSTELVGQADPFTVAYDNSDDFKFKAIIESEASINLVFDSDVFGMEELWTSNERTFKVEYTIESNLEWSGFIIPEGFDYNLKGGKYEAVLTARDGLATLEGILFKTDNNEFYGVQDFGYNNGAEYPFILMLTEILRKLDLGIDLWTLVDYYERTMTTLNDNSRESDPLAISYVNVKTYINDTDREDIAYFEDVNEAWDCQKILENICNIWGSRIYQESGVWKLKSIHADSIIANPYNTDTDPFVGENPVPSDVGQLWKYEAYYSATQDINFDNTQFFLAYFNTIGMNDSTFNLEFTEGAPEGYYLIKGLNKVIYIDSAGFVRSVKNYESAVTNYYWKKYNNTAGYLGRELVKSEVIIPCSGRDTFLKDNDATVRMDDVYKQFRVNFDYTFIRVGDSPINILQNGNFAEPFTQYGALEAPPGWQRYAYSDFFGVPKWMPRGRVIDLPPDSYLDTGGNTNALEMHVQYNNNNTPNTDPNPAKWATFAQLDIDVDQKVTELNFKGWVKYQYIRTSGFKSYYYPVFKAILYPDVTINSEGNVDAYVLENVLHKDYDLGWTKITTNVYTGDRLKRYFEDASAYFVTYPQDGTQWVENEETLNKWYDFDLRIQGTPKGGRIDFFVHGICASNGAISNSFPGFYTYVLEGNKMAGRYLPTIKDMGVGVSRPQFTGLELAYIPDPDEEVPKTDYIYANGDVNYTFQEDPIRVFNGDSDDPEIISNIIVPTNNLGRNKWDTFSNSFGLSDIGMIFCKSIMQQYYKPNRLLDCELKADNLKYGDIIELEHIPNVKFIMLRGTKNEKRGYWEDCTLAQISNDSIDPGGISNGDTLDPVWQVTGRVRCVKDEDGLNTGIQEEEIQDINSNSESFGNFRWQSTGEDLTSCPIGEPSKYYWGTDVDDYDIGNFTDFTISFEDESIGQVQVAYDNTGEKYIYFLHLASLGSIVQISNSYQSQIISSFTYLADVTINGYLYRVLRQNFVTSEFEDFLLTYYIQ